MNKDEYLGSIAKYIGRLTHEVRALNAIGRFDINSTTEDFLVPILRILFSCPDLKNQNEIQQNFPAVDLGCRKTRISFQVTTDASSDKVVKTLSKFKEHNLNNHFDSVYILTVGSKQSSYTAKYLDEAISSLPVSFSKSDNIIDFDDILSRVRRLETSELSKIESYLKSEFEKRDEHSRFRENLQQFLEFSTGKIDVEKTSKKYIPAIFVETHSTKEEMRTFANPMFFYRKIQDAVSQLDYTHLNALFRLAKEPEITNGIDYKILTTGPANYEGLENWSKAISSGIDGELTKIRPLSWHRQEGEPKHTPRNKESAGWSIVRFRVESVATGLTYHLKDAQALVHLVQKKIFLVTSMAGQGKTNFICDLIENQFSDFEIPCVFIPARELNSYPARARILNFISNNRYSPSFTKIHEYLNLFNEIGKDVGKPFVIAIDGINEVKALDEFNDEIKEFCGAVCQYDFVKVLITCRSEFFDEKYASILEEPYREQIHRVTDLRAKMSEASKDRLLASYLEHFKVSGSVLGRAEEFLKNDLLLLRIFCERNEGQSIGSVTEIYKGDLFEDFLVRKFQAFPDLLRAKAFSTLTKIASRMLDADDYAKLSVRDFDSDEQMIVQRLVADDVILRQEIAEQNLTSLGDVVVSFTYDELRDFVIAYNLIGAVTVNNADALESALSRLPGRPIYEGVYKYAYLLARKTCKPLAVSVCEGAADFAEHFSLNIHLLPPAAQNADDVRRVEAMLADASADERLRRTAMFLLRRGNRAELLNTALLIKHMNGLNAEAHEAFIRTLFSNPRDYYGRRDWQQQVGKFVDDVWEANAQDSLARRRAEWIAFFLHASSHARWDGRERAADLFRSLLGEAPWREALELARNAGAEAVQTLVAEIEAPREMGQ